MQDGTENSRKYQQMESEGTDCPVHPDTEGSDQTGLYSSVVCLFDCIKVLPPSQPIGIMSSMDN